MYIKFSSLSIPAKPYALATNSLVIISIRPERCGRSTIIVRHSLMIAMRIIRIIMSEQHLIGTAINNNFFICCSINSFAQHIFSYRKCNKCRYTTFFCNGVQREHNKKLNNGLPILHKVPPKRDYGRYFCIMAEKGGTSHGGLTEKLSPFFHAKKQEVNAYGR